MLFQDSTEQNALALDRYNRKNNKTLFIKNEIVKHDNAIKTRPRSNEV